MCRRNSFFIIAILAICQISAPLALAEDKNLHSIGILNLNIDEVTKLAINNNFDIQIYKLDNSISEKELLKARAIYDAEIDASYEYDEDRLKRASTISGSRITSVDQDISLSKEFPTGTVLSMGYSHQRESSNSSFSSYPSYHESEASISLTQPLGKNALGIVDRNDIKITKLDIENTGYTSMDKIELELGNVQKAYWNLILAKRQLDLTEELLRSAEKLYKRTKEKFEIGLVEQPEFYAVSANLKEREKDLLLARNNITTAQNLMRLKLNLDKGALVVPKDSLECEDMTEALDDMLRIALTKRRDYESAKNDVKAQDLYIEMKKSSMWPEIDLTGTFKRNGLDSKFETSLDEITSQDYPEHTIGVTFNFPLENSSARAEHSQKELQKAKALVSLKKTECLILTEVHDAFVHAKGMHDSVKLLNEAFQFQKKKYVGEENRFRKGRSDTDRLIRYQNDYLNARLLYLKNLFDYKASLIDLRVSMNTLLEENPL